MSMHKMRPKGNNPKNIHRRETAPDSRRSESRGGSSGTYYIYGKHAVMAALENPDRQIRRVLATANATSGLKLRPGLQLETVTAQAIEKHVPDSAVHQGIAAEVFPLGEPMLEVCIANGQPVLVLDQVTDPQNVGAILRSAAAFDAACVVVPKHGAPDESGALAKAASGALELVPLVRVGNLSQCLETLKQSGYWCAGLDGYATQTISQANLSRKTALVMGAEGKGLRRLTGENCDLLVKLPISERMESLNVSNAAAIALYELSRA